MTNITCINNSGSKQIAPPAPTQVSDYNEFISSTVYDMVCRAGCIAAGKIDKNTTDSHKIIEKRKGV